MVMSGFQILLAVVGTNAAVLCIVLLALVGFNKAVRPSGH
jgi:hypothetical protein